MSYHATQFYQAFPHVSTASANAGVRRPGYEANWAAYLQQIQILYQLIKIVVNCLNNYW